MKKISTLSTGIMFLLAILIAGGCKSEKKKMLLFQQDMAIKTVNIYLRYIEFNGEKYLYMYDSNGNTFLENLKSDTTGLITDVKPGTEVFWQLERNSGIEEILKIYSKGGHNIFKEDPTPEIETDTSAIKKPSDKIFKLRLKDNIEGEEKYGINIRLKDETEIQRDPYLRVPPTK